MRAALYHDDYGGPPCRSPPSPGMVVVHLRLGDVVPNANCFYKVCNHYVKTIGHYAGLQNANVAAMTNIHRTGETNSRSTNSTLHNDMLINSRAYLDAFEHLMAKQNNTLQYRLSCHPDEDLTFAAMATKFVQSGGGYSELIAKIHGATPVSERQKAQASARPAR